MPPTITATAPGRNLQCDGFADGLNNGSIKILDSEDTLLVEVPLANPAFTTAGNTVDGRAEALGVPLSATAVATGTAAKATIHQSDDTNLGEGTVGTSGANVNLESLSIEAGGLVTLTSVYLIVPAS